MEFSLQDVQHAAILANTGIVVANVPHPARYALHKLIVMGGRQGAFQTKASKDLRQVGLLLAAQRQASRRDELHFVSAVFEGCARQVAIVSIVVTHYALIVCKY